VVSPSGEAQWPSHRVPSVGTQLHMCVLMFKGSHRRHERLIIWFARCLQGGGVHLNSGTVTITSSSIFGNTAYDVRAHLPIAVIGDSRFARCLQGGGVHVNSDTVTITSSSIYGNTAYWVRAHLQNFPSPSWETHGLLLVCRAAVSLPHLAQSRLRFLRSSGTQLPMCALVKFLSPCWAFHLFCASVCRAAVSSSRLAQWPSHRATSVGTQLHMRCALMLQKVQPRPQGVFQPCTVDLCDIAFPTPHPGA
jgi:hypothetical protein